MRRRSRLSRPLPRLQGRCGRGVLGTRGGRRSPTGSPGRPRPCPAGSRWPPGSQVTLPAGYLIERGTSRGLLLAPVAREPGTMADKLWDPAAPQPGRTLTGVIAVSATQVAWVPRCVARCRVQVLNLATGRPETVGLPAASSVANAAFSPDGSLLAVEPTFSNNSAHGQQAR